MVTAFGQPPDKWKIDNSVEVLKELETVTVTDKVTKKSMTVPVASSKNFYLIFKLDNFFSNVKLDIMRMQACRVFEDGKRQYWEDSDDALARMHIEEYYDLRNVSKTNDAFLAFLSQRKYSPIQERIKSIEWDGKAHCKRFFITWLKAKDSKYTEEASRLHFRQMIERAFNPGCKADYVLVLKGEQGCGKSTVCQWMALEDELFASVKTIEGQKGYEAVQGKFVCELEELLATVGVGTKKEAEVKAYISGQSDHYRRPYDRRTSDNPRTCVFIGTTNRDKFLTDPTGNRRWFPIEIRLAKNDTFVYEHEEEIRQEIEQCFAEMYNAWFNNFPLASPVPDKVLRKAIEKNQEASEMEDHRIGVIEDFLRKSDAEFVCCAEVWEYALRFNHDRRPMTRVDANEIGEILRSKIGCKPAGKKYFRTYGTQHAYSIPPRLKKTAKKAQR